MVGKVLYIEDEEFFATIVKDKLEEAGVEVAIAADGEAALEMVKENKYRLILLDLILPKIEGLVVLEKLKNDPEQKTIPVLVLSNQSEEANRKRAEELGADAYFVKVNTTPNEIVKMVQTKLGDV